jgi:hypothetical protein
MRRVRGTHVYPVVNLSVAPFKTKYGTKVRPHLIVIDWVMFGPPQLPASDGIKSIEAPKAAEIIDDEIPFVWIAALIAPLALIAAANVI